MQRLIQERASLPKHAEPVVIGAQRRRKNAHLLEQALTAFGLAFGLSLIFYALDWHNAMRFAAGKPFWNIGYAWEASIPFRPGWIWVYLAYFPFCCLPLLLKEVRRDIAIFRRLAAGLGGQFLFAVGIFLILPIRMEQPALAPNTLSESAVAFVFQVDPGFNIFPSLHVTNAVFVACVIQRLKGRIAGIPAWIVCCLISASTLFVKQHYALDLAAGFLLGALAYRLSFPQAQFGVAPHLGRPYITPRL